MGADSMSPYKADYSPYLLTAKERAVVQQFEALRDDAYTRLQQSGEKL